jgi:hypothetical protein
VLIAFKAIQSSLSLYRLSFNSCRSITDKALISGVMALTHLSSLTLDACHLLSPRALLHLGALAEHLRALMVRNCPDITRGLQHALRVSMGPTALLQVDGENWTPQVGPQQATLGLVLKDSTFNGRPVLEHNACEVAHFSKYCADVL